MKIVIRPAAKEDILRQYRYCLQEGAYEAAGRFVEAVDDSIEDLRAMPEIGVRMMLKNPALQDCAPGPSKPSRTFGFTT